MADYEPQEVVELMIRPEKPGPHVVLLPAIVIQASSKRVYLRVTLPGGRWAYRWVSQRDVRKGAHA